MTMDMDTREIDSDFLSQAMNRLSAQLQRYPELAVAVSGGVDSMTLAAVAHDVLGKRLLLVHAMSPAVPKEASECVQEYSDHCGWAL